MGILDKKDNVPFMKDGKTPRCQEVILRYVGNWPHFGQCERSAKVLDRCRQHDPEAVAARDKARREREDKAWTKRMYEVYGHSFYKVLKRIAEGHNDPRTLARETLDQFENKV